MFGGSTMMGAEVPDALTIPSQLQALINDSLGQDRFIVENVGATTISTHHQFYRLTNLTRVSAGDVVVFYDGVNDVIQSLYFQNPLGDMVRGNRDILSKMSLGERMLFWLQRKLSKSVLVSRFLNPVSEVKAKTPITNALLTELESRYSGSIENANDFARSRHAAFFHFLQPNIYTVKSLSNYERELLGKWWLIPPPLKGVYAAGYPVLERAVVSLKTRGIRSYDLTDAFDARPGEIFLDTCHVNEVGNRLAAEAIFAAIRPNLAVSNASEGKVGLR